MGQRKRGIDRRHRSPGDIDSPLKLASGEAVPVDRRNGIDRRALGLLASLPMFDGIPFDVIEAIYPHCAVRELAQDEQLLVPGVANEHLYLLLEGHLSVHIDGPDNEGQILIEPGECVGEISIIDGGPVTAFVIATRPSRLLAIPEDTLWGEVMRFPGVARNFMRQSARRFRERHALVQQAVEEHLRFEALEKELAIAAEIQTSMLPQDFALDDRLDIAARMQAARHVGGDFYDVYRINDRTVYVAIGDVAGKGIPAALFVVKAMTILRTEMMKQQPVDRALAALNRALCKGNERCMFVTIAVVVIDTVTGDCRYVSAGHNPAALGRPGRDFEFLAPPGGILTGIDEGAVYEAGELRLEVGTTLLLYTDGVTEAMDPDHALFGEKRMLDCLNRHPVETASAVTQRIREAVDGFIGDAPQSDDLTMVAVRRVG
jgi:sigma-B regulation protein RsbU (phosphoserine phosphatase)